MTANLNDSIDKLSKAISEMLAKQTSASVAAQSAANAQYIYSSSPCSNQLGVRGFGQASITTTGSYPGQIAWYNGNGAITNVQPQKDEVTESLQWAEEKYALEEKITTIQTKMQHYIKENEILKRRIERMKRPWIIHRIKKIFSA